jgi:hypothetical protein
MVKSDVYEKVGKYRAAALEDSRLIAMTEVALTTWFPER